MSCTLCTLICEKFFLNFKCIFVNITSFTKSSVLNTFTYFTRQNTKIERKEESYPSTEAHKIKYLLFLCVKRIFIPIPSFFSPCCSPRNSLESHYLWGHVWVSKRDELFIKKDSCRDMGNFVYCNFLFLVVLISKRKTGGSLENMKKTRCFPFSAEITVTRLIKLLHMVL